ncbi:MAG: sigma-70 family RNA polymerase sigma factor, partial [Planctomycetes bacterium]|nr:sigma-70 family RNA polymerase sigma factor [Planctomycetota bacterium]
MYEKITSREKLQPSAVGAASFATTQWSMVLAAGRRQTPEAKAALGELCRSYWRPLHAYLRRAGCPAEDAEDVVQGFFARLLEKGDLAAVSPERGRFRSFLLAAIRHYLTNERDRSRAAKRGGDRRQIPLEFHAAERGAASERTPEAVFDREWALTLLDRVQQMRVAEFRPLGK